MAKHPYFVAKETAVFDNSKTGRRLTVERQDEPGAELLLEGYGLRDLFADHGGDWSWKPWRDKMLDDKFVTFKGLPAAPQEAQARARSFICESADSQQFQARARAEHEAAGDYGRRTC